MTSAPPSALHARLRRGARTSLAALAGALLASPAPAGAASTFFDQDIGTGAVPLLLPTTNAGNAQTAFLAMLVGSQTESFESFAEADKGSLAIFAGGPVTGTLSDTVVDGGSVRDFSDPDRGFPIVGDQFWKNETTSLLSDELFRVTFSQEVRAFGFFATAWATESSPNDDATQLALYLVRNGLPDERIPIPHDRADNPGGVFYFGVIAADLPFIAAVLRNDSTTDPGDRIGFDEFTVATTIVPEPATGLMLLAGMLGLAALGKQRPGWPRRGRLA